MGDVFESYLHGLKPSEDEMLKGIDYKMSYPGDKQKDQERILNRIAEYDIVIDNFIGWPGLRDDYKELGGGFNIMEKVLGNNLQTQLDNGLIVSELDDHPNEAGHKAIANFLIKELEL